MPARRPIGSRRVNHNGYVQIKTHERQRRWPFEHRVVYEAVHGPLPAGWFVHHLNGIRTDNRVENLVGVPSNSEHHRTHHHTRPEAFGKAVSHGLAGKPKTEEHRAHIAAALRGKTKSPEHRAKIAATLKGRNR